MTITIADCRRAVERRFGLTRDELLSESREHRIARARQIAMALARDLTSKSLGQIARNLGDCDHSTVVYAIRQVKARRKSDPAFAYGYEALRDELSTASRTGSGDNAPLSRGPRSHGASQNTGDNSHASTSSP